MRLKDLTSDVFACVCETRGYPINMDRGDFDRLITFEPENAKDLKRIGTTLRKSLTREV